MPKRKTAEDSERLRLWCRTVATYIGSHVAKTKIWTDFSDRVEEVCNLGGHRELSLMQSELRQFARMLPETFRDDLDLRLIETIGVGLDSKNVLRIRSAIVERGRIQTAKEYAIIRSYLEELEAGASGDTDLSTLGELLDTYRATGRTK